MAPQDQHKPAATPLAKLKQYFDRIRLKYIERRIGNATIIQVQSKAGKNAIKKATPRTDEQKTLRFDSLISGL